MGVCFHCEVAVGVCSHCVQLTGMRPLPEVYRDLAEMAVQVEKWKPWSTSVRSIPSQLRGAAYIHHIYVYACVFGRRGKGGGVGGGPGHMWYHVLFLELCVCG